MASRTGSSVLYTHWFPRAAAILGLAVLTSACGAADDRPGRVQVDGPEATTSNEVEASAKGNSQKKSEKAEC
jgi:hypothetical protein